MSVHQAKVTESCNMNVFYGIKLLKTQTLKNTVDKNPWVVRINIKLTFFKGTHFIKKSEKY